MKRLSIDIEESHHEAVSKLPWGYRSEFVRALIIMGLECLKSRGLKMIPLIVSGKCEIRYKEEQDVYKID